MGLLSDSLDRGNPATCFSQVLYERYLLNTLSSLPYFSAFNPEISSLGMNRIQEFVTIHSWGRRVVKFKVSTGGKLSLREQEAIRQFWSEGIASLQLGCSKGVVRAVITKAAEQS